MPMRTTLFLGTVSAPFMSPNLCSSQYDLGLFQHNMSFTTVFRVLGKSTIERIGNFIASILGLSIFDTDRFGNRLVRNHATRPGILGRIPFLGASHTHSKDKSSFAEFLDVARDHFVGLGGDHRREKCYNVTGNDTGPVADIIDFRSAFYCTDDPVCNRILAD